MKSKTCCFTGHRKLPSNQLPYIQKHLEKQVIKLIHQGVIYYGAGGALGFDTAAAQTILKLKNRYPQIKLILVLPCTEQTKGWNHTDLTVYQTILQQADKVVYTSRHYYPGCMHMRNRHLVDHSNYCIYFLTGRTGGTYYTVNYAKSKGLTLINCALPDLP